MFQSCSSLKSINLSNFDTSKVNSIGLLFSDCSSLKEINIYNFNTSKVYGMNGVFQAAKN